MSMVENYYHRIQKKTQWLTRRITANQRALPNCLIIGAQKAGTSSLYHYLTQHPQIHQSYSKEIHYFDGGIDPEIDTFRKGSRWYRAHFPLQKKIQKNDVCIDATPMYLFNPLTAERIKNLLPEAKLIILLRNPVERAISHYFHVKRHGFESLSIDEALKQESVRLANSKQNRAYKDPAFRLFSYQARGLYLEQIKRYQALFNDTNILILSSEELFQQPENTLQQVFNFLSVDSTVHIDDLKSQNTGNNKQKVAKETYQQLQTYFEQANNELFTHIKQDYHW